MKGIIFCTLIVSLIYFSLQTCDRGVLLPDGSDKFADCGKNGNSLSPEETAERMTHCCLFIYDNGTSFCHGVTDDQYEHIKNYKKYVNEFKYTNDQIDKIKCKSNYLNYSLLIIALFALIF